MSFRAVKIALTSGLLSMNPVHASCLNPNVDTRLQTYCAERTVIQNGAVLRDALLVDALLKREGYAEGIGLPNRFERKSFQMFASPIIDYNSNLNGGNPGKPLILGGRSFAGDPKNMRFGGVIGGIRTGANGRRIYGDSAYADYALSVSYAYSPKHSIGVVRGSASACSRNNVANHWYVDACGDATLLSRDLSTENSSGVALSTTKLFAGNGGTFHSVSFGGRRYFTETYDQNQLQIGWSTVRNRGAYTAINVHMGAAVSGQLAMRRSVSATVGTTLLDRPLTATIGYSHAAGGKLLGFERDDTSRFFSLTYAVSSKLLLSAGFGRIDSTIEYFSETRPTFSVQFAPVRF